MSRSLTRAGIARVVLSEASTFMIASHRLTMEPTLIEPLGDSAFLAHFAGEEHARGWAAAVRAQHWSGIRDVVLAYRSVAVFAAADDVDLLELESRLRAVKSTLRTLETSAAGW